MIAIDERELRNREERAFKQKRQRRTRIVGGGRLLLLIALVVGWSWASGRMVDRLFVSDPAAVVREFWNMIATGQLQYHLGFTLVEVLAGYGIGAIAGLLFAWTLSIDARVEQVLRPFVIAFYGIPKIALAPLIIMWFGLGITPKVFIAAIFVFFVVSLNTLAGIQAVSGDLVSVARVMGANNVGLMRKIVFPSALPYIISALRITIPQAMVGAIIGEFLAGNRGVGFLINSASNQYNTARAFAGITMLLVIVMAMDWILSATERWLVPWRSVS